MTAEKKSRDNTELVALTAALFAGGLTLGTALAHAKRRIDFKHTAEKFGGEIEVLEGDGRQSVAMRKVVASVVQYPQGATKGDIKDILRGDDTLGHDLNPAIRELLRSKIVQPVTNEDSSAGIGLTITPEFAANVAAEPSRARQLIAQSALYAEFQDPEGPEAYLQMRVVFAANTPDPAAAIGSL